MALFSCDFSLRLLTLSSFIPFFSCVLRSSDEIQPKHIHKNTQKHQNTPTTDTRLQMLLLLQDLDPEALPSHKQAHIPAFMVIKYDKYSHQHMKKEMKDNLIFWANL